MKPTPPPIKPSTREKKAKAALLEAEEELAQAKGARTWVCRYCGKRHAIKKLKIVAEKFYVSPHGCTGGDYWTEGDSPDLYITCASCEREVREWGFLSYDGTWGAGTDQYPFVLAYRYSFGHCSSRCKGER